MKGPGGRGWLLNKEMLSIGPGRRSQAARLFTVKTPCNLVKKEAAANGH